MVIYNLIARAARLEKEGRGIGLVLVTDEDQAVGYGQLTLWPNVAEISDLVVAQNLRGRGLGTALIQMLVRQGRALGAHEFEIGAALTNPRAVTLYRRLGFLDSHTILTHTDGKHEKVLYLRLTLGQAQREPARNG
jgi:ribosomal protein S18 acetylase RimI-like enzyme